jgi:hypothetical protein
MLFLTCEVLTQVFKGAIIGLHQSLALVISFSEPCTSQRRKLIGVSTQKSGP